MLRTANLNLPSRHVLRVPREACLNGAKVFYITRSRGSCEATYPPRHPAKTTLKPWKYPANTVESAQLLLRVIENGIECQLQLRIKRSDLLSCTARPIALECGHRQYVSRMIFIVATILKCIRDTSITKKLQHFLQHRHKTVGMPTGCGSRDPW